MGMHQSPCNWGIITIYSNKHGKLMLDKQWPTHHCFWWLQALLAAMSKSC